MVLFVSLVAALVLFNYSSYIKVLPCAVVFGNYPSVPFFELVMIQHVGQ